ncbi:type II toxin-antitoxin system HicB family antitoxin [Xanthobacter agilis]|uniref:type II toxin-antitoxin system HicB family antitoxin n=1 Tax=Xanthobacter agilis TaxID=47492 RepID=UPI003727C7B5
MADTSQGTPPRYFATLERGGPWWSVTFRDCPGCITCGRGRREALTQAGDALATWCAGVPPLRLPRASGPCAGEVLVSARFHRTPRKIAAWGGMRGLGSLAAFWVDRATGWLAWRRPASPDHR